MCRTILIYWGDGRQHSLGFLATHLRVELERALQRRPSLALVAKLCICQAQVIEHLGAVGPLLEGLLEWPDRQARKIFLVIDPTNRVVDVGGIGKPLLRRGGELQGHVEIRSLCRVDHREVVGRQRRVVRSAHRLLVPLPGLVTFALRLEQYPDHRAGAYRGRIALDHALELGARFVSALLSHVELRQHGVSLREARVHGHGAPKRLLGLGRIARSLVHPRREHK